MKNSTDFVSKSCETQSLKISALVSENVQLRSKVEGFENYQRLDSLIFHGLDETSPNLLPDGESAHSTDSTATIHPVHQSAMQSFLEFCSTRLHLTISEADITRIYRIPAHGKSQCRPLVVGFTNRRLRDRVYEQRKTLRDNSTPRLLLSTSTKI